jgi:hydrogen peroxide-dependent heme synthase
MTSNPTPDPVAVPPETLEGWYALHQLYALDRRQLSSLTNERRGAMTYEATQLLASMRQPDGGGWTIVVQLVGSVADLMIVHFRASLDAIGEAQRQIEGLALRELLTPVYSFLSVTEAGLYHLTAQLARVAAERNGQVGDEPYRQAMAEKVAAERESEHVQKRLYPTLPQDMPYVCFYPMDKRRDAGQNWYTLSLDERSRLMFAHSKTGRRYAGRIQQIITGAIGFDSWEWGVTLFAKDPLDFKKLVSEMRFDEVSAKYAEFGEFYVGKVAEVAGWIGG